ncbi:MAG: NUDIX domain-containing protein, partial [Bacteroidota bacterium]
MYVIYINDRPLTLLSKSQASTSAPSPQHLVARYSGKARTLLNYVDMLEKASPKVTAVTLVYPELGQLWADFKQYYRWVPAAGGVVHNAHLDKHLFIFRRGSWDLPKGKIDEGESPAEAAIREVEEETGLADLRLGQALPTTYHTYRTGKGKRVLKPTYWFAMQTETLTLTPQAEEDIELAEWRTIQEVIEQAGHPLYESLRNLLLTLPS